MKNQLMRLPQTLNEEDLENNPQWNATSHKESI